MCALNSLLNASEINFLVVHKKLRSKRLAPVLIKEVTRRCNIHGVFQAVYTAGVVLPTPVAVSRYYHRTLNAPKLIDIGFAYVPRGQTLARFTKSLAMPAKALTPGWREMEAGDLPQVTDLLGRYLARFDITPEYDTREVEHWLLSGRGTGEKGANGAGKGRRKDQVTFVYVVEVSPAAPAHLLPRSAFSVSVADFVCRRARIPTQARLPTLCRSTRCPPQFSTTLSTRSLMPPTPSTTRPRRPLRRPTERLRVAVALAPATRTASSLRGRSSAYERS